MTFMALLTASLRFQRRHILGRTIAVATGLVMMVAVLELQGALVRGIDTVPGDLGPSAAVVVRGPAAFSSFGAIQRPGVSVDALAVIGASGGVTRAEGDDHGPIGVIVDGQAEPTVLGTWFTEDSLRPAGLAIGEAPSDGTVVVTDDLAKDLGLDVADPIELIGRSRLSATVAGIVTTRGSEQGAPQVYAPLLTTNALVGAEGVFDRVVVAGNGTEDEIASSVFVNNPDLETLTRANYDGERVTDERNAAFGTRRLLTLFAGIAMAVTALIVISGTAAAVVRRTGELATLRTAGATPRQVRLLILAEAGTVGVVGGLVAGPLGTIVAIVLQGRAGGLGLTTAEAGPRLDLIVLGLSVLLGVILGIVGAWFPARRAGRLSVHAALGDLAEAPSRFTARAAVVGAVVAAAGLVISGTGSRADADLGRAGLAAIFLVAGSCVLAAAAIGVATRLMVKVFPRGRWPIARLAVGNLDRSPARTSGTAISVLVGIGLVMLTAVFTSSFQANVASSVDRLYRVDTVVTGAGDIPGVGRADADRVAEVFGIDESTPLRLGQVKIGSSVGTAVAVRSSAFLGPAFSDATISAFEGDGILVRSGLGIARGTKVTVVGAAGEVRAEVVGTYPGRIVDASGGRINAVLPLDLADQVLAPGLDQAVLTRTIGEVGPAAMATLAESDPALAVQSGSAFARATASSGDRALALSLALLAMTLVTSVIGLANTIAASVTERRREMSVLRALGVGTRQLSRLVTFETAILSAMVAVAALVVATATGAMLIGSVAPEGTPISIPWLRLTAIGVAATAICSLAGLVPAVAATRVPVQSGLVDE